MQDTKPTIRTIGVITHPEVSKDFVHMVASNLKRKGVNLLFDPLAAGKMNQKETNILDMDIDLAVILGGDGTLLWSVNELRCKPLVLGINTGRIGYLAELDASNLEKNIKKIFSGEFIIDERSKLRINDQYEVLNEAVILPKRPAALLEFRMSIGREKPAEFRADGLLVSTQTGSTGHSLSLGGPIMHPDARAYLITPIAPFMQEQPPVIVPDSMKTTIELAGKKKNACMVLDGNTIRNIKYAEKTVFEKSRNTVRFIRFSERKWKLSKRSTGYLN